MDVAYNMADTTATVASKARSSIPSIQPKEAVTTNIPVYTPSNLEEMYKTALPYLIIDINDIREEMVRHTANYAYLTQELARAKGRVADMKTNLEYQKGLRFITCKQSSFVDVNGKKCAFTDALAKSYVDIDEDVIRAKQALADAERVQVFWQLVLDAMYQRSYMLTKLAEMQQHELLLAGNEYNAGIKQQLYKELSDDEYAVATETVKRASQHLQEERLQAAMQRIKDQKEDMED